MSLPRPVRPPRTMTSFVAFIRTVLPFVLCLSAVAPLPAQPKPSGSSRGEADLGPWLDTGSAPAVMRAEKISSKLAGTEVSYVIYLPPGYDSEKDRRYPVVYWLHGRGGSQTGAGNFAKRLDAAIKAGKVPPAIVVGLNGRKTSSWVDTFDGSSPVQSVIIKELIPHIDATYRTIATREGRAIEGFSMGGAGAPKIGFKYPELFGTVGVISGALQDFEEYSSRGGPYQRIYGGNKEYYEANDAWTLVERNADAIRGRTFVRIAVGDNDNLLKNDTRFHELLTKLKIEHGFDVIPGAKHDPSQVYDGLGDKTWTFYSQAFGAAGAAKPAAVAQAPAESKADAPAGRREARAAGDRPWAQGGARVSNDAPNAWVGVGTVNNWQTGTVKASDGVETPILWAAPEGKGPFPAVVWFHGAPPAQGERGERNEADRGRFDLFLKAGFVVVLGDYRAKSPEGSSLVAADDAIAIIRHVKSMPMVDPNRVAAMGHSLGSATNLLAVSREKVACVVDSAAAGYAILGMPMGSLMGKPAGGELTESDYDKAHALSVLGTIDAPTLIFYGESDPLSRINKTIYDLMKGLGKNVRLETYPGEHHGMLFRPNDKERGLKAWTTMLEFVSGVLQPTSAAPAASAGAAPATRNEAAPRNRVPEGVKALTDLAYVANGHAKQKLDLYLPEKADKPTPLIVWIHGGGWAAGDKSEGCPPLNSGFTKYGYAVANLNYRLSGDAIFPAQIEDCKAALRWLRAHAAEYNLDPAHIGVWGGSAGGHLVALLGATNGNKVFDVGAHLDQSSDVQAAVDFFGPTDIVQMDAHALPDARLKHDAPNSPEARLVGGPIQNKPYRDVAARVNPIPYLTSASAPYLIVHGDADPTVPHHQSELLYAALKEKGLPVRFHTIKGAGHGTGFGGKDISDMVGAFFEYRLMGKKTAATDWPADMTSTSEASAMPAARARVGGAANDGGRNGPGENRRGPTWEQAQQRDDKNHDGKISRDEFSGPPPIFERLDRNGDGVLTAGDFGARPASGGPPTTDRGPGTGGNRPPVTWEMVSEREDANHDGKVTREEFKGPAPMFDRLDRDHDGVLTAKDFSG